RQATYLQLRHEQRPDGVVDQRDHDLRTMHLNRPDLERWTVGVVKTLTVGAIIHQIVSGGCQRHDDACRADWFAHRVAKAHRYSADAGASGRFWRDADRSCGSRDHVYQPGSGPRMDGDFDLIGDAPDIGAGFHLERADVQRDLVCE